MDTPTPAAGACDLESLLDTVLACSRRRTCAGLRETLSDRLEPLLKTPVKVREVRATEPTGTATARGWVMSGDPSGGQLHILPQTADGHRAIMAHSALLKELAKHLAGLYPKIKRIERLEAEVARTGNPQRLSPREQEASECLREGLDNADIADRMGISRRTVEKHFESIYDKLNLENRYQLLSMLTDAPK